MRGNHTPHVETSEASSRRQLSFFQRNLLLLLRRNSRPQAFFCRKAASSYLSLLFTTGNPFDRTVNWQSKLPRRSLVTQQWRAVSSFLGCAPDSRRSITDESDVSGPNYRAPESHDAPFNAHPTIPLTHQSDNSTMQTFPQPVMFHKFNYLPAELRQLIWKAALPPSRIILLEHKRRKCDASSRRIDRLGFRTDAPNPHILLACREAYTVASSYYQRAFSNRNGTSIPEIYFDFANDFLYLGREWGGRARGKYHQECIIKALENVLHPSDLSRIQNLAIWWGNYDASMGTVYPTRYIALILSHFGNVQHLIVVSKIYRPSCDGQDYRSLPSSDYKFLDGTKVPGADIAVRGVPILGSSIYLPKEHVDFYHLEMESRLPSPIEWKVPVIEYNVITTPRGEELLLESAMAAKQTGDTVLLD